MIPILPRHANSAQGTAGLYRLLRLLARWPSAGRSGGMIPVMKKINFGAIDSVRVS